MGSSIFLKHLPSRSSNEKDFSWGDRDFFQKSQQKNLRNHKLFVPYENYLLSQQVESILHSVINRCIRRIFTNQDNAIAVVFIDDILPYVKTKL